MLAVGGQSWQPKWLMKELCIFNCFGFQAFRIFQREMSCHFLWPMPFYWSNENYSVQLKLKGNEQKLPVQLKRRHAPIHMQMQLSVLDWLGLFVWLYIRTYIRWSLVVKLKQPAPLAKDSRCGFGRSIWGKQWFFKPPIELKIKKSYK